MVLAGEVFSEEWRTLMGERTGGTHPCLDSASLYGTADAGVLATETPLSVCIRRHLADHPAAARELFGQPRLPTLAQYDPRSRLFEMHGTTLVFTGDNGIPLIRYHLAHTGGPTPFDQVVAHYPPPQRQLPRITVHRNRDPEYFPPGVKHRYSR